MLHIPRWKAFLIIALCVMGLLYALPNVLSEQTRDKLAQTLPSWMPTKAVNLGLDLQGGSHLLLEADTRAVVAERLEAMMDAARAELRRAKVGYTNLAVIPDSGVTFTVRDLSQDREAAYRIARGLEQDISVSISGDGRVDVTLNPQLRAQIVSQVIGQSIEIVRRRIDETGTREPIIQRQGTNRIVVQLPGIDDPESVKALLGKTAKMSFHLVDMDAPPNALIAPPGSRRLPMQESPGHYLFVKKRVMISGEMLVDSQPAFEQGAPVVSFRFNSIGSKRFCDVTRNNVGQLFAIVLDDQIISAPRINGAICGGSGIITGNFTVKEANDLSLLLRAGALPAPLEVVEERTVGPTLGSDSIEAGKKAGLFAMALVVVLMIAAYGLFGFFAVVALFINMACLFALMSLMSATLTLPGIAGIVLTIGMAVDSNVLIFERMRDEIRNGRSAISAADSGYKLAMSTIIDANLTTLIVALLLFSFGSGPVKGFAVTTTLGMATSLFSSIMVTRLMIAIWIKRVRPSTLTV